MRFSTALRESARKRLERLGEADIVVGIPCYNNESTIANVIKVVEDGLSEHFPRHRAVVIVSDGGSVDDSREEANSVTLNPWSERIVMIYRGVPGKGSALRGIFESAKILNAKTCVLYDADLRSITPEWIKNMIEPIHNQDYDFVAPFYKRYKYDGTITNNIVYNLTRSLYGQRIRQPIGGDFACSNRLLKEYLTYEVWETDVGRFGIDIWMTTIAIVKKMKVCQAFLGVKIHNIKDPSETLGPMFTQVVSTLFTLMEENYEFWKSIKSSEPIKTIGKEIDVEPEAFSINLESLIENFQIAFDHFGSVWETILEKDVFNEIKRLVELEQDKFVMLMDIWVKLLYSFASTFHKWKDKKELVSMLTPLYFARIASFVNETKDLSNDEAEKVIEKQSEMFEEMKSYLLEKWEK